MAISAAEIAELNALSNRDGVQNKDQRLGQIISVNDSKSTSANTSLSVVGSTTLSTGDSKAASLSTLLSSTESKVVSAH